jgi:zinc protease
VLAEVSKRFGDWARGPIPGAPIGAPRPSPSTTIYLLDRPGAQQSFVSIGTLGPDRTSPELPALDVLGTVLGATTGSRLYRNLREQHSYMYSGAPFTVTWRRTPMPSVIGGWATVSAAKTDSALIEWLAELRRIHEEPPSDAEMMLARGSLTGALPVQMETDDLIANRVVSMLQNDLPLDFYNSYGARIAAVAPAEVTAAAAKYVDPSHLVIVIAGDRKVVEPLLRAARIAPIVIVDENGKP